MRKFDRHNKNQYDSPAYVKDRFTRSMKLRKQRREMHLDYHGLVDWRQVRDVFPPGMRHPRLALKLSTNARGLAPRTHINSAVVQSLQHRSCWAPTWCYYDEYLQVFFFKREFLFGEFFFSFFCFSLNKKKEGAAHQEFVVCFY